MGKPPDELALYDRTRARLRDALAGRLPDDVNLEKAVTENAYWVCLQVLERGADWEEKLSDYVDATLRRAAQNQDIERREAALLRRELARRQGAVLDVGAGWGRLGPLYAELGLGVTCVDPAMLGARLMQRDGLDRLVQAVGEALPFPAGRFATTVIGWVLHHDGAHDVAAARILSEAARVTAPGGLLISVEPVDEGFSHRKWLDLLLDAGFAVHAIESFFQTQTPKGKDRFQMLAVCTRRNT